MKIAIVTRKMIIGGVEKALVGMLRKMSSMDEVDLYVEQAGGELFGEIPSWVRVVEMPRKGDKNNKTLKEKLSTLIIRLRLHCCKTYSCQCELSALVFPKIMKEYDLAIAYHAPNTIPVFYVANNLNARKKVLWLHGDVESNQMTGTLARKYYKCYDHIFTVSKQTKEIFDFYFPELSKRSQVFYNIIDDTYLKGMAEVAPTYTDEFTGVRILTIGRLDFQKGIDRAIETCRRLIECGISVRWYVCGEGEEREKIEALVSTYCLKSDFVLLGNQKNPYGYLRDCDIYVQPSRTEGFCTATNEARIFGKAVVVTNVCGMKEQFVSEKTGIICDNDIESLFENIKRLIKNPELRFTLSQNVKRVDLKNDIQRLYQIAMND